MDDDPLYAITSMKRPNAHPECQIPQNVDSQDYDSACITDRLFGPSPSHLTDTAAYSYNRYPRPGGGGSPLRSDYVLSALSAAQSSAATPERSTRDD